MITGYIDHKRHALIPIDIFDRKGRLHRVEGILDTGFDDFLALPTYLVQRLGLIWLSSIPMKVATSTTEEFDTYAAEVLWLGIPRSIRVLESPEEIIVGTRLLWESQLIVQFWEGGSVSVQARDQ